MHPYIFKTVGGDSFPVNFIISKETVDCDDFQNTHTTPSEEYF